MTPTPELDQVAAMRRKLAATAQYPRTYWVLLGVVLVAFAGVPIWLSYLPESDTPYLSWGIAAVGIAAAGYAVLRRRRSGVYLPKRITAYPSAVVFWAAGIAASVVGFLGIQQLVGHGLRGVALGALPVVAVAVFAAQVATQRAVRRDVEAGRVVP